MLYGLGMILLLLSVGFVGGSIWVPVAIATLGMGLMSIGRRPVNGKKTRI